MTPQTDANALDPNGLVPQDIDWDADIDIVEHPVPHEDGHRQQLILQNLRWEDALYYDGPDFRELLENQYTDTYHEKLDGHCLVAYQISNPRINPDGGIIADGRLYLAHEFPNGDYHTNTDFVLKTVTVVIRPKDPRTDLALRQFLAT